MSSNPWHTRKARIKGETYTPRYSDIKHRLRQRCRAYLPPGSISSMPIAHNQHSAFNERSIQCRMKRENAAQQEAR
jgi:hypothetical protein